MGTSPKSQFFVFNILIQKKKNLCNLYTLGMKIHFLVKFSCLMKSCSLALVEGLGVREKTQAGAELKDSVQGEAARSCCAGQRAFLWDWAGDDSSPQLSSQSWGILKVSCTPSFLGWQEKCRKVRA